MVCLCSVRKLCVFKNCGSSRVFYRSIAHLDELVCQEKKVSNYSWLNMSERWREKVIAHRPYVAYVEVTLTVRQIILPTNCIVSIQMFEYARAHDSGHNGTTSFESNSTCKPSFSSSFLWDCQYEWIPPDFKILGKRLESTHTTKIRSLTF